LRLRHLLLSQKVKTLSLIAEIVLVEFS